MILGSVHPARRWPALLVALACGATAATAATAGDARASCVPAVVVDGRVLLSGGVGDRARLPRVTGEHPAVSPACADGSDEPVIVMRLQGLPPRVAVLDASRRTLYAAEGTVATLATHPLHGAFRRGSLPSLREGRRCRARRTPVDVVALEAPGTGSRVLRVDVGAGGASIGVDSRTRIVNRPAYEPIRRGQRLSLRTSACGGRRVVADRIAFTGPAPREERYRGAAAAETGKTGPGVPLLIPIALVAAAATLLAILAAALLPRARPRDRR